MSISNPHIGSSLDELLEEDGTLAEVRATAVKRVLAFDLRRAIEQKGLTNSETAARMRTSRAALDRLLNPQNRSVTLLSMSRAAATLDKDLRIELVDRPEGTDGDQVPSPAGRKWAYEGFASERLGPSIDRSSTGLRPPKAEQLSVFLAPMKFFEWEGDPAQPQPENPTPTCLLKFLCALGLPDDMAAFEARYRQVSQKDQRLVLFPLEPRLVENLFDPLRQAKTSYLLGNYLGAIGLCGMVAEKVAILVYALSTPDERKRKQFERTGQARRIRTLKDCNLVSKETVKAFGTIRAARNDYLHSWTSTRDDKMARVAVRVYGAAVQLVFTVMKIGFKDGHLRLSPPLVNYLDAQGEIRPA